MFCGKKEGQDIMYHPNDQVDKLICEECLKRAIKAYLKIRPDLSMKRLKKDLEIIF
jgi:hypothetical protein